MRKNASLFTVAITLALAACDVKTGPSNAATAAKAADKPSFATQPLNNSWPAEISKTVNTTNLSAGNYYIVFDGSGSMQKNACGGGGYKIDVAKAAVKRFIQSVPATANIGLFVFDRGGTREVAALGAARDDIIHKIDNVSANGSTPLAESVKAGMHALTAQAQSQLGYGEYDLVVITDGEADDETQLANAVTNVLASTPIVVHTIGFCIGDGHSLNRKGKTLYYAANSEQELSSGLQQVLAEAPEFTPSSFSDTATQ